MRNHLAATGRLAMRGLALFLGTFTLIALVGELRGRTTDVNLWWVDIRDLPGMLRMMMLATFAVLLLVWAVRDAPGRRLRQATAAACAVFALLAVRDGVRFLSVVTGGLVHPSFPVPFSLFVTVALGCVAIAVIRVPAPNAPRGLSSLLLVGGAALGWGLLFPLAQMFFFGATDYRRPADAAVIFGARVYASGRPSPLLADRIRTGVELYRAGLVSTLVMSGGDGADGFNEARIMRDEAVAAGIDPSAVLVDPAGVTTEATVGNTMALLNARGLGTSPNGVIAVSQAYHLPRVQLTFATAGIDVLTVPAAESQPISEMPLLVLREVPAFWVYYLRVCLG
jgi:vancomycin permeability regulator SanA